MINKEKIRKPVIVFNVLRNKGGRKTEASDAQHVENTGSPEIGSVGIESTIYLIAVKLILDVLKTYDILQFSYAREKYRKNLKKAINVCC